jgi:hypothetical protein
MKPLLASFILIALFAIPLHTYPTCIIILKGSNGAVYISADDREALGNDERSFHSICKVYKAGRFYVTMAGYGAGLVQYFAPRFFAHDSTPKTAFNWLARQMVVQYHRLLYADKQTTKQQLIYLNGDTFASVVILDFPKSGTKMYRIDFKFIGDSVAYKISQPEGYVYLGIHSELNDKNDEYRKAIMNPDLLARSTSLLMIEKRKFSVEIGDTIDRVIIDPKGTP